MSPAQPATVPCFHCGLQCSSHERIEQDDHRFCCVGCRTVYSLLRGGPLDGYYSESISPTDRIRPEFGDPEKFAFLDNPEIADRLRQFSDGNISRLTLSLPQIHCASCIWLLERAPELSDGIQRAEVNFPAKELMVILDESKLTLRGLVELLSSLGYEPTLRLDSGGEQSISRSIETGRRSLHLKIGVAGFVFGNTMLLSFPEYLTGSTNVEPEIARLIGVVSIVLSLPVLLYAGNGYFRSAWIGLRNRSLNIDVPIVIGALALFFQSVYEILSVTGTGYLDSLSGLIFFLLLGRLFQEKTYSALSFERDYRSFFPLSAQRIAAGKTESVALDSLSVGDRLMIRHGELVPADAALISGTGELDYSFVTGESETQHCHPGDKVLAGGRQCGGAIEIELIHNVAQSYLTRLWSSESLKTDQRRPSKTLADHAAQYFTPAVLLIALLAFFYWLSEGIAVAINAATATLIVACPCALALTAPFAHGAGLRLLARAEIFVKNAKALERLSQITDIVFDKTGTLTNSVAARPAGQQLSEYNQTLARSLARHSSHPASRAVTQACGGSVVFDIAEFSETPGGGISALVDEREVRLGSRKFVRVSAAAPEGDVYLSVDGQVIGVFSLPAELRDGIHTTTEALRRDYSLTLLSGDSDRQKELMQTIFTGREPQVYSVSPSEKMEFIKGLSESGKVTMMVGDGLNDAGALAAAEIGVALCDQQNGFSPASDLIINDSALTSLPAALRFSKRIRTVILAGFALSLSYNIAGLTFAVAGELTPVVAAILMPLSSITVVAFATTMVYLQSKSSGLAVQ